MCGDTGILIALQRLQSAVHADEGKVKTTLFRVRGKLLDYLKKEGYAL